MAKTTLTISIDDEIKERAKIVAIKARISLSQIIELLLDGITEQEIIEIYEKK